MVNRIIEDYNVASNFISEIVDDIDERILKDFDQNNNANKE
jgi:hypothetical protein